MTLKSSINKSTTYLLQCMKLYSLQLACWSSGSHCVYLKQSQNYNVMFCLREKSCHTENWHRSLRWGSFAWSLAIQLKIQFNFKAALWGIDSLFLWSVCGWLILPIQSSLTLECSIDQNNPPNPDPEFYGDGFYRVSHYIFLQPIALWGAVTPRFELGTVEKPANPHRML